MGQHLVPQVGWDPAHGQAPVAPGRLEERLEPGIAPGRSATARPATGRNRTASGYPPASSVMTTRPPGVGAMRQLVRACPPAQVTQPWSASRRIATCRYPALASSRARQRAEPGPVRGGQRAPARRATRARPSWSRSPCRRCAGTPRPRPGTARARRAAARSGIALPRKPRRAARPATSNRKAPWPRSLSSTRCRASRPPAASAPVHALGLGRRVAPVPLGSSRTCTRAVTGLKAAPGRRTRVPGRSTPPRA